MVVNLADDDFTPKSTLFVGNKWDQVPEGDKRDVENSTYSKLSQVYPGVRKDQIHYMSVMEVG